MQVSVRSSKALNFKSIIMGVLCLLFLLGWQLTGIVHEISHDPILKNTTISAPQVGNIDSFGHDASSKTCKLFEGLALSGFIATGLLIFALLNQFTQQYKADKPALINTCSFYHYSSRAPPVLSLSKK